MVITQCQYCACEIATSKFWYVRFSNRNGGVIPLCDNGVHTQGFGVPTLRYVRTRAAEARTEAAHFTLTYNENKQQLRPHTSHWPTMKTRINRGRTLHTDLQWKQTTTEAAHFTLTYNENKQQLRPHTSHWHTMKTNNNWGRTLHTDIQWKQTTTEAAHFTLTYSENKTTEAAHFTLTYSENKNNWGRTLHTDL